MNRPGGCASSRLRAPNGDRTRSAGTSWQRRWPLVGPGSLLQNAGAVLLTAWR
jgi:hypothetical protein